MSDWDTIDTIPPIDAQKTWGYLFVKDIPVNATTRLAEFWVESREDVIAWADSQGADVLYLPDEATANWVQATIRTDYLTIRVVADLREKP